VRQLRGHVLAVDDNEINQSVAEELLKDLGLTVDVVGNGLEAFHAVQSKRYSAVLMDCQMPVMDGYSAATAIRAWERENDVPRTPIIALTAHAFSGERDKVLSAGMDDYMTKPVPARQLESVLARWLVSVEVPTEASPPVVEAMPAELELAAREPENDTHGADLDPEVPRSAKLIELFLRLVPKQLDDLYAASRQGEPAQLRAVSHKLKGSAASLGARAMARVCENIQHAAESGDVSGAQADSQTVRALFAATAHELQRELTRARSASV
jgi:CheY-like chemotaxis protein